MSKHLPRTIGTLRRDGTTELRRSYVMGDATSAATEDATYAADGTRYAPEDVSAALSEGWITSRRITTEDTTRTVVAADGTPRVLTVAPSGVRFPFKRDAVLLRRAVVRFVWDAMAEWAGLPGVDVNTLTEDAYQDAARRLLMRRAQAGTDTLGYPSHYGYGAPRPLSWGRTTHHYRAARHAVTHALRTNRAGLTGLSHEKVRTERTARYAFEMTRDGYGVAADVPVGMREDGTERTVSVFVPGDTSRMVNVRPGKAHGSHSPTATAVVASSLTDGLYAGSDVFTTELFRVDMSNVDAMGYPASLGYGTRVRAGLTYPNLVLIALAGSVREAVRLTNDGRENRRAEGRLKRHAALEYAALMDAVTVKREAMPQASADAL